MNEAQAATEALIGLDHMLDYVVLFAGRDRDILSLRNYVSNTVTPRINKLRPLVMAIATRATGSTWHKCQVIEEMRMEFHHLVMARNRANNYLRSI